MSRHRRLMLAMAFFGAAGVGLGVFVGVRTRFDTILWFKIGCDVLLTVLGVLGWWSSRRPGRVAPSSFFWKKAANPDRRSSDR